MPVVHVILVCVLLLISYIFDLSNRFTKIPSVILMLSLGFVSKLILSYWGVQLPDFHEIIQLFGTLGLILIVLEGSMELKIKKEKFKLIFKSSFIAFVSIVLFCSIGAFMMQQYLGLDKVTSWFALLPLSIISSAIAITTASVLDDESKEFVIYESSLSDIFGIILFNFMAYNAIINFNAGVNFFFQTILVVIISAMVSACLGLLLMKINHKVKYIPIVIVTVLIYFVMKYYHLPSLVFVMVFGIMLKNLNRLKKILPFNLDVIKIDKTVHLFEDTVIEFAFLVRTTFFVIFGMMINLEDVLSKETFPYALAIVGLVFLVRTALFWGLKIPSMPLLWIAPRGLITILLMMQIPRQLNISWYNNALITQIIILFALIMMVAIMIHKKKPVNFVEHSQDLTKTNPK